MSEYENYQNPLIARYASRDMAKLWGDQKKFSTWRRLWVMLAEAEKELGIEISQAQIDQLAAKVDAIDFDNAKKHEQALRHDVMAHVHAFRDACPDAGGIIHLGATSCFVTDNGDLLLLREALELTRDRLVSVIDRLATFAEKYAELPCLGYTHLQPAQPVTVGRRAALWAYDFVLDLEEIEHRLETLKARSIRGASGTQASFLELFGGDEAKVAQLQQRVAEKMGFDASLAITGQTYSRKLDSQIVDVLSGIAQSAHKTATDLRILAHKKEMEEPFQKKQIGSSAMPYKRNPMRSERICALARFAMSLPANTAATHATQWMERTLDDSANRRLVLPQAFLAVDAILILLENVSNGLVVYPKVVAKHLAEELPFMASENIMMEAVAQGGDRQELHELIRVHSLDAATAVKEEGADNDLLERLKGDKAFAGIDVQKLIDAIDPADYTGRSVAQTRDFIANVVEPIRAKYGAGSSAGDEVRV